MGTSGVSEEELQRYRQDGILAGKRAIEPGEAQRLGQTIITIADELLEDGADIGALSFRPWEGDVHPFESPLAVLTDNVAIRNAVQKILGDSVMLRGCEIFYKPGVGDLGNQKVPWHWDYPIVEGHEDQAITVWVALTESGPHNGGLQYIHGSHRAVVERGVADPKQRVLRGADLASFSSYDTADVSMEPGEFSIHHACVLHGSDQNEGAPRLGVAMRFFSTEAPTAMIGNQSGLAVIGDCNDGHYEPTNNYPIQWWDREQESVTRVMRTATRLSITDETSKNLGRILSSNSCGLIEFIEEEIRKGWEESSNAFQGRERNTGELSWTNGKNYPLTEEGGAAALKDDSMVIIDGDRSALSSWQMRLGGWSFLNQHLVHVPEEESTEVFDVGAMSPPIVFRPRRHETNEPTILLSDTPVSGFSADLGIWVAHHGDVLASHSHGCLIALPPVAGAREFLGILGLLEKLFNEAQLPSLNWNVIVNASTPGSIEDLEEMTKIARSRVAGIVFSRAEYAGQLFRKHPQKRTLIMDSWWHSQSFKTLENRAIQHVMQVAQSIGAGSWTECPDTGEWTVVDSGNVTGEREKTAPATERPPVDVEANLNFALDALEAFKNGASALPVLEACRSQQHHWVCTGVRMTDGGRLDARSFSRQLRNVAAQRNTSPRSVALWRQLVLGRDNVRQSDSFYALSGEKL